MTGTDALMGGTDGSNVPEGQEAPDDPPAHDQFPAGSLVAITEDDATAAGVVAAARGAGADAYLLGPAAVLSQDAERRDSQGPVAALWELLGSFVSDQRPLQDRYLDHARAGRTMVVVGAADQPTAERLWQAMRAQGAYEGTWYGTAVISEMV